jgi:hypothetical protein
MTPQEVITRDHAVTFEVRCGSAYDDFSTGFSA